jgi:hypothetical protein
VQSAVQVDCSTVMSLEVQLFVLSWGFRFRFRFLVATRGCAVCGFEIGRDGYKCGYECVETTLRCVWIAIKYYNTAILTQARSQAGGSTVSAARGQAALTRGELLERTRRWFHVYISRLRLTSTSSTHCSCSNASPTHPA